MEGVGIGRRRHRALTLVLIGTLVAVGLGTATPVLAVSTPVAHWKLDDGSGGTANDDVGTADGTVSGSPIWLTSGAAVGTGALRFDGVNDKVTVSSAAAIEPQELMLTLWVRGDPGSPPAAGQVIVERGDFSCAGPTYGLYVASNGIRFSMRVEDGQQLETTATQTAQHVTLWDGSWHLLAANAYFLTSPHRTVIASLSIDGYPSPAGTFSTTLAEGEYTNAVKYAGASSSNLLFGGPVNAGCGGTQFKGDIDDVRIYADPHFDATSLMPAVPRAPALPSTRPHGRTPVHNERRPSAPSLLTKAAYRLNAPCSSPRSSECHRG